MKFRHLLTLLISIIVCLCSQENLKAQDIHFSQYYASPVTLNPALTGLMDGCYRGSINYRNQYPQLYKTYSTVAASFDAALLKGGRMPGFIGVGMWFYNDRQGDGPLNDLSIHGLAAYHLDVTGDGRYLVSLGTSFGWNQKSLDFASLLFSEQQVGQVLDPNASNGEPIQVQRFNNFNASAGGSFSVNVNDNVGVLFGMGIFNLLTPKETYLNDNSNDLGMRYLAHFSVRYFVNDKIILTPRGIYMTQTGASTYVLGSTVGYIFNDARGGYGRSSRSSAIYGGLSYRWADALILTIGFQVNELKAGLSYDINVSSLNQASNGIGGLEFSLVYERKCYKGTGFRNNQRGVPPVNCPRF